MTMNSILSISCDTNNARSETPAATTGLHLILTLNPISVPCQLLKTNTILLAIGFVK